MDRRLISATTVNRSSKASIPVLSPFPETIGNLIGGVECAAQSNRRFLKLNPVDGSMLSQAARSDSGDVNRAVAAARDACRMWDALGVVRRTDFLIRLIDQIVAEAPRIAQVIALETGRSQEDARAEIQSALELALMQSGESRGLTGHHAENEKRVLGYRVPKGVVAAVHGSYMPFTNLIRYMVPALLCGNTIIWKPSMTVPGLASYIGRITQECDFPAGVFNIVHGSGSEAGRALCLHSDVNLVDFAGSESIARVAKQARRTIGRAINITITKPIPIIVCDDANVKSAAQACALSIFASDGRSGISRDIFIAESIYEEFRDRLLREAYRAQAKPIITERKIQQILHTIDDACKQGARLLCGGFRFMGESHRSGYFLAPTVIEFNDARISFSLCEVSGPLACLHCVRDAQEVIDRVRQSSPTSICIHTRNHDIAQQILRDSLASSVVVNGPSDVYGAHPVCDSIDIFSDYKTLIHSDELRNPGTQL
jgi:acyl-CoA reductase-like NAD-dependent aldehyde dehydrogenase